AKPVGTVAGSKATRRALNSSASGISPTAVTSPGSWATSSRMSSWANVGAAGMKFAGQLQAPSVQEADGEHAGEQAPAPVLELEAELARSGVSSGPLPQPAASPRAKSRVTSSVLMRVLLHDR